MLDFHVQVERSLWAVIFSTGLIWAYVCFFDFVVASTEVALPTTAIPSIETHIWWIFLFLVDTLWVHFLIIRLLALVILNGCYEISLINVIRLLCLSISWWIHWDYYSYLVFSLLNHRFAFVSKLLWLWGFLLKGLLKGVTLCYCISENIQQTLVRKIERQK